MPRPFGVRRVCWLGLTVAVACSGEAPLDVPAGCQPIAAGASCALPYPSDFFRQRTDDGTFEVHLTGEAKPRSDEGINADLSVSKPIQAFSRLPLIVATFAVPASAERLVSIFDPPDDSTDPATSATLILDTTTGDFVPHFADIDALEGDGLRNALVLHPLVALAEQTRYVVAVVGLTTADGKPMPAPDGFARLRDGRSIDGYERFDSDVFDPLATARVSRADLQLAWDFTTGADEEATNDMAVGRMKVLDALAEVPPIVVVEEVIEDPPDAGKVLVWREIHGTITAPMAVDGPDRGAHLLRDAAGQVRLEGVVEIPFIAMIPDSLRDGTTPGRVIGYGHGFFGDSREVVKGPPQAIANELGAVLFGIDWQGMSLRDVTLLVEQLVGEPSRALDFADRVHQAMFNWLAMTHAIKHGLADHEAFRRSDGTRTFDPSSVSFIGISQGHILGGVLAAVNPDLDRIALNVGGAGLTHMMYRSKPFEPFLELLALAMTDPLERLTYVATMQRRLDAIDPAVYAPRVLENPFERTPATRKVLLQIGVADTSVPDVTGFYHARRLGAGLVTPSPVEVYGLRAFEEADDAGLTVFDFGADRAFMATHQAALSKNEVHDGVRQLSAAIRQLDMFFGADGTIVHPCDGPCDPE